MDTINSLNWRRSDLENSSGWKMDFASIDWQNPNAIKSIYERISHFGIALISDFPTIGRSDREVVALLTQFVLRLGCPVSQSEKLDFLGHVTDRGNVISNHKNRGYESAEELPFHSDRCDLLSLLCLRQAPTGGQTRLVSAYAAYKCLSEAASDLANELCQPVPFDLRDSVGHGSWAMMPVFSFESGTFVSRYVRRFIEASQRFDDAPRLTDKQRAAFDALDTILDSRGMSLDLRMEPGEWLLIDNHRMLHARTEFHDADDPAQARLLLRSWLCWPESPELPSAYAPTYGRTKAGSLRGGVWPESLPLSSLPTKLDQARTALQDWIA